MNWQLQDAKNRLRSRQERAPRGTATVTVRGERAAVVMSAEDYDALIAGRPASSTICSPARLGRRTRRRHRSAGEDAEPGADF